MALTATEIPDLYPEFTTGEMSVGPVSQLSAPGMSSYYFARIFDNLPPGRYTIRATMNDAGSLWVGSQANSMRMIATFTLDEDITAWEYEFELNQGDRRFDVYVHNLTVGASACGFIFSLYRNGKQVYASRAENWRYETTGPVADADLLGAQDTRRATTVFTVLPNWADGILERLEYMTDVMQGELAVEQRRALRTTHRRSIEAGFARTGVVQDRLHNFFTAVGARPFMVPLWHEQVALQFDLSIASPTVMFSDGSLAQREFRPGDTAIVFEKNPADYDVVIIQEVDPNAGMLLIGAGITRTWGQGARIIPLRLARLMDAPSMTNRTDEVGVVQVRFELLDPTTTFGSSWGHVFPLFKLDPNWAEAITTGYDRLTFAMDTQLAQPFVVDPSDQSQPTTRANFTLKGRNQVVQFRRLLNAARGRAVRFYAPSHTSDLHLKTPLAGGETFIDIEPSGLWETMLTSQMSRRVVAFIPYEGTPIYRKVVDVNPVGLQGPPYRMSAERLSFATALPAMGRIKRISWLQCSRFDQDTFELHHPVGDSVIVRTALVFRAVSDDGMGVSFD